MCEGTLGLPGYPRACAAELPNWVLHKPPTSCLSPRVGGDFFFFPIWMIRFSKSPKGFGEVNLCSSKQVLLDFVFELREIISISEMTVNIKGPQWKRQPLTLTRIMSYYRNIILSANPLFKKIQRLGRCSKEFREISQSKAEIHSLKQ